MDLRRRILAILCIGLIQLLGTSIASPRNDELELLAEPHEELETLVEPLEHRPREAKINTELDPNDFENNEIEGSTKKKPTKIVEEEEEEKEESNDWISYILKFFGYKSVGDLLKNVDIFSIPQQIQNATRTYKEEIGLGQCYMEFTTFAVFSQEDSVFYNYSIFRNKRDASGQLVEESRAGKDGQANMINNLVESLISMLQRSPATAKYGTTIKQLLPHVMSMMSHDNPQQAMMQFATTNLLPLISSFASGSSNKVASEKISYQNQSPSASQNSGRPTALSSLSNPGGSGLSTLMSLASTFLAGGNRKPTSSSPNKQPVAVKKPQVVTKVQTKEDKKKSFIQTILDFIYPLFISIVGSAPGDNGVETLRQVSRLSTLSRVDDALLETVNSPFFCAKNYLINKAWSLTENGVKKVVGYIDTAQQERMSRMLTDYEYEPLF